MQKFETLRRGPTEIQSDMDGEDFDDYDSEYGEEYTGTRRRTIVDIDKVSLVETPRSARIRNALENPTITLTEDRTSIIPKSNFFTKGIERSFGTAQPQKLGKFHNNNGKLDTIINHSINFDLESKQDRQLAKVRDKKIEVGPMKGEAAETKPDTINPYKILE